MLRYKGVACGICCLVDRQYGRISTRSANHVIYESETFTDDRSRSKSLFCLLILLWNCFYTIQN